VIEALLASGNPHKLRELRELLPGWRIEPLDAGEEPEETGATYYENALLKARFGRALAAPGRWVLGEDSGIECNALDGAPGLRSARWAPGRDQADALVERLEGESERGARMVSELVCLAPAGEEFHAAGVLEGAIAGSRRGEAGFGYDPVFVPDGFDRTVAELGDEWKRRNSHRARSARALAAAIGARGV
jgi:non-canonical purine NTP pyrophosphatase (RdgB/HAM1 family)